MPRVSFSAFLGIAAVVLFAAPLPARADLKIVSEVTSVKDGMTQKPFTETTFVKDEMVREDRSDGATFIHDLTSDTYFYLDNLHKVCATLSGKGQSARESALNTLIAENADFSGTANVKPGGKTKTIAGKIAKNYTYSAVMKVKVRGNARQFLTLRMSGETWVAPNIAVSPRVKRMEDAAFARSLGPLARAANPLLLKIAKVKGYPLSNRSTTVMVISGTDTGATQQTVTRTQTVTLVSDDPLEDSLFIVPSTYRDVSPEPNMLPDDVRFTIIN